MCSLFLSNLLDVFFKIHRALVSPFSIPQNCADCHLSGQRIVVVTHGGVIREFFNRAAPRGSRRGKILNVSVNVLRISDKMEWSIKSWGDVSHLDGVGYLGNAFGGDRTSG